MKVTPIKPNTGTTKPQPVFKRRDPVVGEKPQPEPKFHCCSCTTLKPDHTCNCFKRHVEPDYNRCFFHSQYRPIATVFRPANNLEEIIEQEEKLKAI